MQWQRDGKQCEGVYIPRRDTSSRLNTLVGGRIFPGEHHHARFDVDENDEQLSVRFESDDTMARVSVKARLSDALPSDSVFQSVEDASRFFEAGSLGYSATSDSNRFDGLEMCCRSWSVQPLAVGEVRSSYFDDRSKFPEGSAIFDCALLMRGIEHEWHSRESINCGES